MKISAVSAYNYNRPSFGKKEEYENPINRGTERGLAIWGTIGGSALAGATAAGISTFLIEEGSKNRGWKLGGIGVAVGLGVLALTLPAKLYDTKVKAFTREKEMDVFTRDRELKSNIMEEVNNEVKDKNVDLDTTLNHFAIYQLSSNGNGVVVKGV